METSGKFWLNLPNASGRYSYQLWWWRLSAVVTEELTGDALSALNTGIFRKSWKVTGRNASATLYPRKIRWPWTLSNRLRQRSWLCCSTNYWSLHQRTAGEIRLRSVHLVYLTLHVGLGTFRPVLWIIWTNTKCLEFYQLSESCCHPSLCQRKWWSRHVSEPLLSHLGNLLVPSLMSKSSRFWLDQYLYQTWVWVEGRGCLLNQLPSAKSTLVIFGFCLCRPWISLDAYHHAIQEH